MATIAEQRNRVRAMYQSIGEPPQFASFPEPPARFVDRKLVLERARTAEAQREIWHHLKRGQAKQWVNYDAFHQAAMQAAF